MSDSPKAALAASIAAGYLLGRTRKGKLAIAVATFMASGKLQAKPQEMLAAGMGRIGDSPQFAQLTDQVREELLTVGRQALKAAVDQRLGTFADSLANRTKSLNGGAPGAEDGEEDEEEGEGGEDRERDGASGENEEDEEEGEEEGGEEPEDEEEGGRKPEGSRSAEGGGRPPRPPREGRDERPAARKGAKKTSAKKAPAKKAPPRKTAKKTSAKKSASKPPAEQRRRR